MRRPLLLLLVAGLAAGACSKKSDDSPDPTVPTAVSSTTPATPATTAEVGIDTIPDVIDAPYLNRVLAALDQVDTAAIKVIMQARDVPPEAAEIFNSIYDDKWFKIKINSWIDDVLKDPDLRGLKRPLGDRHTTVERLITVSPRCIWMAVKRDYSDSDVSPPPPRTEYVALRPLDRSNDPKGHNPTAWMITADGFNQDGSEPLSECSGA